MDILEIRDQPLSTLLADFYICDYCSVVDSNRGRARVGYECPRCKSPSKRAMAYFPTSVGSLIDLMQEFYHLEQETSLQRAEDNHKLAVVIFFCSLGEVLLQHFLETRMSKMEISSDVQARLLDDNLFVKQRVDRLFPTLTGVKWNKAIALLTPPSKPDYLETTKFYQNASDARNKFLHRGNKWVIAQDMPKECMQHVRPLIWLFVSLHNKFVAQPMEESAS